MGGRQRTTLFMGVGEEKKEKEEKQSKEQPKGKEKGKKGAK